MQECRAHLRSTVKHAHKTENRTASSDREGAEAIKCRCGPSASLSTGVSRENQGRVTSDEEKIFATEGAKNTEVFIAVSQEKL